jgi:hypothetical protein
VGALDHGRIEVDTGHIQAVPSSESDRQMSGPASDLKDATSIGDAGGDVSGDAPEEGAEQEPAHDVVSGDVGDQDATRHGRPGDVTTGVSKDDCRDDRKSRQDSEGDRKNASHDTLRSAPPASVICARFVYS